MALSSERSDAASETDPSPSRELGSLGSLLVALARTDMPVLAPGTLVAAQYRIERKLGEGGMGVVYLALDTRLDRPVAIKLCAGMSDAARRRFEREALALAKLAHPHVVVVHQAGELDERAFLVMEYVAGGTLRAWLSAQPRRVDEILALLGEAGAGLAAAHALGLVHCDFKPDNVLVGEDGRARVADFGLARALLDTVADARRERASALEATQPGHVGGTPGYMAPEQQAGHALDARSDQYAFAVTLWEALMGWRPGVEGRASEPSQVLDARVPSHVVAALRRGLAEQPERRWPSLAALLAELRRDVVGRRRRTLALLGGLTSVALLGAWFAQLAQPAAPGPCDGADAGIEQVWNAARADALAGVLGPERWPTVAVRIEQRVAALRDAQLDACVATHVDARADAATLHERMVCLDARRDELDATLVALESGSAHALANAPQALELLPDAATCLDDARAREPALPNDPSLRVEIARARRAIAEVDAAGLDPHRLDEDGKSSDALALARATGWAPVIVEALLSVAFIDCRRGRDALAANRYTEAIELALEAGADRHAVDAMLGAVGPLARIGRDVEARQHLATARAMLAGLDAPSPTQRLMVLEVEAELAAAEHRPAEAADKLREHLAALVASGHATPLARSIDHFNLANYLGQAGELDAAERDIQAGIALVRETLGAHPNLARHLAVAATIAMRRGEFEQAEQRAREAVAIEERWFGHDGLLTLTALDVLAIAAQRRGRVEEAERWWARRLELVRRSAPDDPDIPKLEINLAIAAVMRGDLDRAATMADAGLATLERLRGREDASLVQALVLVGHIARVRPHPDLDASLRAFERARELAREQLGVDHSETINTELMMSDTLVALARADEAVVMLEPRLGQFATLELPRHQPAELRYALARALAATGRRDQACELADEAQADLAGLELDVEPIGDWLARTCKRARASARR